MVLNWVSRMFARDLAIDLGTANTLVFVQGDGIVLDEPSIVTIRVADGSVVAVGREAKEMVGRTPGTVATVRPLKNGVIADLDVAQKMLEYFITKTAGRYRTQLRPRIVIGVPSGITQVEKRAVRDSAMQAGAREVYLIEEPTAAAIGAGMPIQEPGGNMILTIGGGTTEVAVISLSGVVHCESLRTAGDELNEAIAQYLKKHYGMLVGERRAEEIKLVLGARRSDGEPHQIEVKGSDAVARVPKAITITEDEVRDAVHDCIGSIVASVRSSLERTPPEIAADMVDSGIVLTGGGALLTGLDEIISKETRLPVTIAEDPLTCVVRGLGALLEDIRLLERVALDD